MMKRSAWLHWTLAAYLWLITWIPLGNWNRQHDPTLLMALLSRKKIDGGDLILLALVTLPAILFWLAYQRNGFWLAIVALSLDVVWLAMQIQSWWLPYVLGTNAKWQLDYAKGSTTKVLPSFGRHVAPDGMHFVISVLLIAALASGIVGLREARLSLRKEAAFQPRDE